MRKFLFISTCTLLLAACTGKEILVTDPVDLNFKLEEVQGSRIIFSADPTNPDACYAYGIIHYSVEDLYNMGDRELAEYLIERDKQSYETRKEYGELLGSFVDYCCYRGGRTLRITNILSDTDYRLLVYQVNPKTCELLGNVVSVNLHTLPVSKQEMHFSFEVQGDKMTITPDDPERTYYWDYDLQSRIYDNYMSPFAFYYSLLDMFDEYGFMKEVYSKGVEVYDFEPDRLIEGELYVLMASACEDEEITSQVTELTFVCQNGKITILSKEEEDI